MFLQSYLFFSLTFSVFAQKLNITIYFESYCKYSRQFIQEQLKPVYENIRGKTEINYVPFGAAEVRDFSSNLKHHSNNVLELFNWNWWSDIPLPTRETRSKIQFPQKSKYEKKIPFYLVWR